VLIVHEGAYYPDFKHEKLDEETFKEYLSNVDLEETERSLWEQYLRLLELVESNKFFRTGHFAKYFLQPHVSHTIEWINFDCLLFGLEAEFYGEKILKAIHDESTSKAIHYITLSREALAKEIRARDENLMQQLTELSENRKIDFIIVLRGSIHSYITDLLKSNDAFEKVTVYNQPWKPSPMERWMIAQLRRVRPQDTKRIAATEELAYYLKTNQLIALGHKPLQAREQAIAMVAGIPKDKIDRVLSLSRGIKVSEFEKILSISSEE
jgi:hypothetical protein